MTPEELKEKWLSPRETVLDDIGMIFENWPHIQYIWIEHYIDLSDQDRYPCFNISIDGIDQYEQFYIPDVWGGDPEPPFFSTKEPYPDGISSKRKLSILPAMKFLEDLSAIIRMYLEIGHAVPLTREGYTFYTGGGDSGGWYIVK